MTLRFAVTVLLAGFLALALFPGRADAHALLVRSQPEAGARLAEAPDSVSAWFSEPLEPGVSKLRVLAGDGEQMETGEVIFDPADETKMAVALREEAGPGFYLVTWETLSRVDGHFRFGSFEFTVLNPDGSEPTGPRPESSFDVTGRPTGVAEGAVSKIGQLVGIVLLAGLLGAVLLVLPAALRQLSIEQGTRLVNASRRSLAAVGLSAVLLLVLVGVADLWLQARQFGGAGEIETVLDTQWGERWMVRHFLLLGVGLFLGAHVAIDSRLSRGTTLALWLSFAAALSYMLFVSLVSHANAIRQGYFWATASDFVHLAAAALWVGGLLAVGALLIWSRRGIADQERPGALAAFLRRFSLLAATSLLLLVATGVFNALAQVSSWSALVDTAYGRALLGKLIVIVPLLAVAAVNAFILRPGLIRAASQNAAAVEHLRAVLSRLVNVEAALALSVLAIAGVLVQYTPARVESEASAALQPQIAGVTDLPGAGVTQRDAFGFPLTTADWHWVAAAALLLGSLLVWIWAGYLAGGTAAARRLLRTASVGLAAAAVLVALAGISQEPGPGRAFDTAVALRYQATDGRLVLLEIDPFQVGANQFKITVMTESEEMVPVESVELRFADLEEEAAPEVIRATPGAGEAHFAEQALERTGWWEVAVLVDNEASATFYLRLDNPSLAPLEFAPPDYQSDPAAEQLFQEALEGYEALSSLRWREELTSGLLDPTGIGAWVISEGQAEAPDRNSYQVVSPGASNYRVVSAGPRSCFQDRGEPWQCREGADRDSFDLDYLEPSTAFRLGRRETVDGEMTQVVLFNNPAQASAWYGWWIGEETGYLRRQAMVAPGHFMLTHFFDHNQPVDIELPPEAASSGG